MKKNQLSHAYVTLLDLPEAMPFGLVVGEESEKLSEDSKKLVESDKKLFAFVKMLEKDFGERVVYIGEDVIGEKFYKRFLFEKNGFVEIMTGAPVVVSAHFIGKARADKFAEALRKAIKQAVRDPKPQQILLSSIEVSEEESERISYDKWEKLKDIRGGG
jgi:hypothetical protein